MQIIFPEGIKRILTRKRECIFLSLQFNSVAIYTRCRIESPPKLPVFQIASVKTFWHLWLLWKIYVSFGKVFLSISQKIIETYRGDTAVSSLQTLSNAQSFWLWVGCYCAWKAEFLLVPCLMVPKTFMTSFHMPPLLFPSLHALFSPSILRSLTYWMGFLARMGFVRNSSTLKMSNL